MRIKENRKGQNPLKLSWAQSDFKSPVILSDLHTEERVSDTVRSLLNHFMLKQSLRGIELPVEGSSEMEVFESMISKLKSFPIESSSITFHRGLFYFALYMKHGLKLTFSRYCDGDDNLYTTFIETATGNIIREDTFETDTLVESVQEIYRRLK